MNSSSNSYSVSVPWSNQRQLGQMKCSDCEIWPRFKPKHLSDTNKQINFYCNKFKFKFTLRLVKPFATFAITQNPYRSPPSAK
jgi:hypothetical protein